MEYADVYDAQERKTGRIVPKDTPLSEGEYVMSVGIWIRNKEGQIFATRRSLTKRFMPGKWENTGGHVQAGETPVEAVIRELKEETGIDVTADQIVYLGEATREAHGIGKNYGVTMDVNLEDLFFSDGEVMDARWLSREEFERMRDNEEFAPSVFRFMEGYKEGFLQFMGWEDRDGRGSSRKKI